MNKKIKIIELFKRIEKHENIPQKIKYKDNCYVFKHTNYSIDHLYELIGHECIGWLEHKDINLFDEVEILEDIEEIKGWGLATDYKDFETINHTLDRFGNKINELIKKVNELNNKIKDI